MEASVVVMKKRCHFLWMNEWMVWRCVLDTIKWHRVDGESRVHFQFYYRYINQGMVSQRTRAICPMSFAGCARVFRTSQKSKRVEGWECKYPLIHFLFSHSFEVYMYDVDIMRNKWANVWTRFFPCCSFYCRLIFTDMEMAWHLCLCARSIAKQENSPM